MGKLIYIIIALGLCFLLGAFGVYLSEKKTGFLGFVAFILATVVLFFLIKWLNTALGANFHYFD